MHEESGPESWGLRNTREVFSRPKKNRYELLKERSAMRETLLEVWNVDIAQAFCKERQVEVGASEVSHVS